MYAASLLFCDDDAVKVAVWRETYNTVAVPALENKALSVVALKISAKSLLA